jgi:hypothetical protein
MLLALIILISVYLLGCIIKFGIPESLSATYYSLGKDGWIFQVLMLVIGGFLLPVWLSAADESYQFFAFLACASICFVAVTPCFKLELQGRVHYSAAIVCCISVFTWQILEGLWDVMLWFVWVGGMLTLTNRSKWCWWLECAAIGSLFANLWRLV